jgi:hypothetical protein
LVNNHCFRLETTVGNQFGYESNYLYFYIDPTLPIPPGAEGDTWPNVFVPTANLSNDLQVYPNPAGSTVTVEFSRQNSYNGLLELTTTDGHRVQSRDLRPDETRFTLDLTALPAGIYYVRTFLNNGEMLTRPLILK